MLISLQTGLRCYILLRRPAVTAEIADSAETAVPADRLHRALRCYTLHRRCPETAETAEIADSAGTADCRRLADSAETVADPERRSVQPSCTERSRCRFQTVRRSLPLLLLLL